MTDQPIFETGGFGWIPSSWDKKYKHNELFSASWYFPIVATSVEVIHLLPPEFKTWYNQGQRNACVGASTAQLMAFINLKQIGKRQYDWLRHYCLACEIDHDPVTTCQRDIGTTAWAGLDVIRNKGAYVVGSGWKLDEGIAEYRWINPNKCIDETRTALAQGQLVATASPWFEGFNPERLVNKNGEWWFPPRSKWGRALGGHMYGRYAASDIRQATGMSNTWGDNYYDLVWMDNRDYEFLHTVGAESAALIDRDFVPPPPPVEPPTAQEYIDLTGVAGGKNFAGRAVKA